MPFSREGKGSSSLDHADLAAWRAQRSMITAATPSDVNWRHATTYDYAHALPRRGWAWEFLRRNAVFHEDWTLNCRNVAMEAVSPRLNVATLASENGPLCPWGLHFQQ